MFTAALFTVAKIGKQPRRPSVDEWIKCGVYNELLHSNRKNKILPIATWMDSQGIQ